jgi:O-antigen/teichoic acid export membrane protein
VLAGLSVQHGALLRRQMRFSVQSAIDLVSLVLGIAAAVTSAWLGAGYWALVYQQLVQQAVAAAGAWLACGWRPGPPAGFAGVRPLILFGSGLTRFNVLNYLSRNLDNVIIGRVAGATALGLYVKAYALLMLPVDRIRGPVSSVVVPALSRLQHDDIRFERYFLKAMTSVVALGMPVVAFSFVFAEDAILVVLGPQWRDSITLFRVLAPAAFLETFNTVGSWACLPLGKSRRLIRWQMFATLVMVTSFLIGVRWGALGVAGAFTASTIVLRLPGVAYLLRGSPVSTLKLLRALARPAAASIGAAVVLLPFRAALSVRLGRLELLLSAVPVFCGLYAALWLVMPGGREALGDLAAIANDLLPPRRSASPGAS